MIYVVARRSCALALLLVMTSCGAPNDNARAPGPAASSASQPGPAAGAVPFAEYRAEVQRARYDEYARKPGTVVQSEPMFEEMRWYLLNRYDTAQVDRSYLLGDATFDCVGTADQTSSDVNCPPGTRPVRRVTLAKLVRFPTLQSFLGQSPGRRWTAPGTATDPMTEPLVRRQVRSVSRR
jgi:hypothetical protein